MSWIVTFPGHYGDVIMGTMASQITSLTIVYSTVYSDADQRKHQSSTSLAFVRGIHRGPENSPHKWPVTRKMFPFDDVFPNYNSACDYLSMLRLKLIHVSQKGSLQWYWNHGWPITHILKTQATFEWTPVVTISTWSRAHFTDIFFIAIQFLGKFPFPETK